MAKRIIEIKTARQVRESAKALPEIDALRRREADGRALLGLAGDVAVGTGKKSVSDVMMTEDEYQRLEARALKFKCSVGEAVASMVRAQLRNEGHSTTGAHELSVARTLYG